MLGSKVSAIGLSPKRLTLKIESRHNQQAPNHGTRAGGHAAHVFWESVMKHIAMKDFVLTLALVVSGSLSMLSGCDRASPQPTVSDDHPLTIEAWRKLDSSMKYELETLNFLRDSNPRLMDEHRWRRFKKAVVVPQRQIDFPADY